MLIRRVHIRAWTAIFYFDYDSYDIGVLEDALVWADAPNSIIQKVSDNATAHTMNEGFCYSNPTERKSVIGVGVASTGPEFLDSTVHELAHLAQDIAHTDGIDPFGEEFAYLTGDISHEISDIVCEMSCPHCRCQ